MRGARARMETRPGSAGGPGAGLNSAVAITDAEVAEWFPDGRRKVSEENDQTDLSRVPALMNQNRHFTLTPNAAHDWGASATILLGIP